jgi:drug/metabolite transporter (DMT)-like permease
MGAIGCAMAGILVLALQKGDGASVASGWGYALLVGAVLCEASYVVIGKRLSGKVSPRSCCRGPR